MNIQWNLTMSYTNIKITFLIWLYNFVPLGQTEILHFRNILLAGQTLHTLVWLMSQSSTKLSSQSNCTLCFAGNSLTLCLVLAAPESYVINLGDVPSAGCFFYPSWTAWSEHYSYHIAQYIHLLPLDIHVQHISSIMGNILNLFVLYHH